MIGLTWWLCISHLQDKICCLVTTCTSCDKDQQDCTANICLQQMCTATQHVPNLPAFSYRSSLTILKEGASQYTLGLTAFHKTPEEQEAECSPTEHQTTYPHLLASTSVIANRIINTSIYNLTRFQCTSFPNCAHTLLSLPPSLKFHHMHLMEKFHVKQWTRLLDSLRWKPPTSVLLYLCSMLNSCHLNLIKKSIFYLKSFWQTNAKKPYRRKHQPIFALFPVPVFFFFFGRICE